MGPLMYFRTLEELYSANCPDCDLKYCIMCPLKRRLFSSEKLDFRPIVVIWAILGMTAETPFHRNLLKILSMPQVLLRVCSCFRQS
jgi:hypothetical protein